MHGAHTHRRPAIKNATVAATGRCNADAPKRRAQVVIVGAGLAGLAAAQRLFEGDATTRDVVILEAQDRVGGRVHTVRHSNYVLEMGAQWLHGADDNPLYQWLTARNMLDDFEDASLGFAGLFCAPGNKKLDEQLVARVLDILVESKLELSKTTSSSSGKTQEATNAANVFRLDLEEAMDKDATLSKQRPLVDAVFEWFLRYETIENGAADTRMSDVSIASYTDWTDWGEGTLLNFKRGYASLLQWFCAQIPASKCIHLNKRVLNIDTSSSGGGRVVVRYADEGGKLGTIECEHVIVTVPLGHLKQNLNSLFTPPLPQTRRDLISSLGFGTVNKIVLEFEKPFWRDAHGIKLVWPDAPTAEFPSWTRDILSFDVVRRQPNLLIGWLGGEGARLMERETDEQIGRTCMRLLERVLPEDCQRPTRLVSCVCSRWHSNAMFGGSYSYQSTASFTMNTDKLHEPIYDVQQQQDQNDRSLASSQPSQRVPRVMFAGEATAGKLYSTTHGAIITGWREADRLRDCLKSVTKSNANKNAAKMRP